jgi:DNA-binding beta-propeller fold protein YncE
LLPGPEIQDPGGEDWQSQGEPMRYVLAFLALVFAVECHAQQEPLRLIQTMALPGVVEGKFDHLAVDIKGNRLFLAARSNKTIEVFDLATGKRIHSISGYGTPHAEYYVPGSNELLVAVGDDGTCKFFRGDTFELIKSVKISVGADSIVYDPGSKYLYIVNGGKDIDNNEFSLVSVIDATKRENLGDIRVEGAELEAMAVERSGTRLFVNMKTLKQVGIIDRNKRKVVATWPIPEAGVNTPMTFDEAHHRLFVGARVPSEVVVFDTDTGKVVARVPCVGDADDMSYDSARKRIYVTGEEGFISVIAQTDADHYQPIAKIKTRPNARNSLFVPELNRFFVGVPRDGNQEAEVLVFQVQP